jgi:hypothetical protein
MAVSPSSDSGKIFSTPSASCFAFKPTAPNEAWSMDFVMGQLQDGTRFRALTIVDVYTREVVAIGAGQSLKGDDVVRTLNRLKREPACRRCCSVTMAASSPIRQWTMAYRHSAKIDFSRPGKPTDSAFVESFNGTFRCECLDAHWFLDLKEAKHLIETWRQEYNESRPHRSHCNLNRSKTNATLGTRKLGPSTPGSIEATIATSKNSILIEESRRIRRHNVCPCYQVLRQHPLHGPPHRHWGIEQRHGYRHNLHQISRHCLAY